MAHVLETGLEFMNNSNPDNLPKVKGYNIINGQLTLASDNSTFVSKNPAVLADELGEFPLSTRSDVHDAIAAARDEFLVKFKYWFVVGGMIILKACGITTNFKI